MNNNTSPVNTVILIVILVLLVAGGVWWYQTYGPGAPEEPAEGLEINIGSRGDGE